MRAFGFSGRRPQHQLVPTSGEPKRKKFAVYDIESKAGPSQSAGFTRPFLVGFYDGLNYRVFEDKVPLSTRWRRCRFCRQFRKGYDPHRLCTHPSSKINSVPNPLTSPLPVENSLHRPCELQGWEEFHLKNRSGCIDQMMRHFLQSKYNGYVLYAHNGGSFDHLFILTWLQRRRSQGYRFTVVPVASTIQQISITRTIRGKKFTWSFRDSMRLFPGSLDKFATSFLGKDKSKLDIDLDTPEDDLRWGEYLQRDCIALYGALEKFHDLVEQKLGGEVGMTAPSTSMKLFRRRFQHEPIHRHLHFPECKDQYGCPGCFHDWVRLAYYGGRTEIFEMVGEWLHYFDINSSYVAAMLKGMPVGKRIEAWGHINPAYIETYVGFAEVTVYIPQECVVPPLPVRAESGKLIFPKGTFKGIWDVEELELLKHPSVNGQILEIGRVFWIEKRFEFKAMMEALWVLREAKPCHHCARVFKADDQLCSKNIDPTTNEALPCKNDYDEGLSELGKLFGNSFYGKFGMDPNKEEIVFARAHRHAEGYTKEVPRWMCFLCGAENPKVLCDECKGSKVAGNSDESGVWFKARRVEAPYIIPQIAAHITALARICLFHHFMTAFSRQLVVAKKLFPSSEMIARITVSTDVAREAAITELLTLGCTEGQISIEAGRVFNGDTDSLFTNVEVPSSKELGDLKDEYPGEYIKGTFIQPKVYIIEKEKPFPKEHTQACILAKQDKKCKGCATRKIAMKGLPKKQRTYENILSLMDGGTVEFDRLEKVRTLAGVGFSRPPQMSDVSKRIVEKYDKRVIQPDGVTTEAITMYLPESEWKWERRGERELAYAAE